MLSFCERYSWFRSSYCQVGWTRTCSSRAENSMKVIALKDDCFIVPPASEKCDPGSVWYWTGALGLGEVVPLFEQPI